MNIDLGGSSSAHTTTAKKPEARPVPAFEPSKPLRAKLPASPPRMPRVRSDRGADGKDYVSGPMTPVGHIDDLTDRELAQLAPGLNMDPKDPSNPSREEIKDALARGIKVAELCVGFCDPKVKSGSLDGRRYVRVTKQHLIEGGASKADAQAYMKECERIGKMDLVHTDESGNKSRIDFFLGTRHVLKQGVLNARFAKSPERSRGAARAAGDLVFDRQTLNNHVGWQAKRLPAFTALTEKVFPKEIEVEARVGFSKGGVNAQIQSMLGDGRKPILIDGLATSSAQRRWASELACRQVADWVPGLLITRDNPDRPRKNVVEKFPEGRNRTNENLRRLQIPSQPFEKPTLMGYHGAQSDPGMMRDVGRSLASFVDREGTNAAWIESGGCS